MVAYCWRFLIISVHGFDSNLSVSIRHYAVESLLLFSPMLCFSGVFLVVCVLGFGCCFVLGLGFFCYFWVGFLFFKHSSGLL